MHRSTATASATAQVATGQGARKTARPADLPHAANSPQPPHVDGALWLAHPAEGDAHGCPLRSLLKRGLSTQELKLAYMAIEPALAKNVDESSFVRRLEGKPETTATPTQAAMPMGYWTISEYAKITKRSRSSLYTDMNNDRLPFVSVGRRARRIPMSVLAKLENDAFATKVVATEETANAEPMSSVTCANELGASSLKGGVR